jgi:hypothetical protein
MQIIVELDGVLRTDEGTPIPIGIVMASTLTVYNKLTYLSSGTKAEAELWLNTNKIVDFDNVLDKSIALVGEDLVERQLKYARANGPVDLFITGNPSHWAFAFDLGIASVMFGQPSYIRPEFRPDMPRNIRKWSDIESAVAKQNAARTTDLRLTRTESLNFE